MGPPPNLGCRGGSTGIGLHRPPNHTLRYPSQGPASSKAVRLPASPVSSQAPHQQSSDIFSRFHPSQQQHRARVPADGTHRRSGLKTVPNHGCLAQPLPARARLAAPSLQLRLVQRGRGEPPVLPALWLPLPPAPSLPRSLPGFLHHSPSHLSQPAHMKVAERDWERSAGGPAAAGSALNLCL